MTAEAYIRREILIGIGINIAIAALFYWLVFGGINPVPLWGMGNWVFDFLPQSFMTAFMSTLATGAIAAKKLKAGAVDKLNRDTRLPQSLLLRALLLAVATAIIATPIIALLVKLTALTELSATAAMILKMAYGGLLSVVLTPLAVAPALLGR